MPDSDAGTWELDLWNGVTWFSEWFYDRLSWTRDARRRTLNDLRPHLLPKGWEALLTGIRSHLESATALDQEILVQLDGGRVEHWRVTGAAERNSSGLPVYFSGAMHNLSTGN